MLQAESWYVSRKGDIGQDGTNQEQEGESEGRETTFVITESIY
jgi:hypothetical protein